MLPADYPFELRVRTANRWRPRLLQVGGIAASVGVHLGVLLYLLTPVPPMPPPLRAATEASSLQVILLDAPSLPPPVPAPRPEPVTTPEPHAVAPRADAERPPPKAPPAPPARPAAPVAPDAPVSAARLFGGIEGAARDLTASDRPLPGAGRPSAMAQLPGSSVPIVDLPVRFKKRPTPQQIAMFAARIVLGTMAANPDDMESARNLRDPLQDLTDAHMRNIKEPECNDPDDPLRDARCIPPPRH